MTDWRKVTVAFCESITRETRIININYYHVSPAFLLLHMLDFLIRCMQVTFDIKYGKLYITSNDT